MSRRILLGGLLALTLAMPTAAADTQGEIAYLLDSVASSGCTFTRNGTEHSAREARDHLAMKAERAGARIRTAEEFVDRLASESSWTGKPYTITCAGVTTPSRTWLTERLEQYRAGGR